MKKLVTAFLFAGLLAAASGGASAGQVAGASGVRVNNQATTAGTPVALTPGDVITTGSADAVVTTAGGDQIRVDKNSQLKFDSTTDGVEYYFLVSGTATGNLSTKSSLGNAVSWATAPDGGRTEVRVEAPSDRAGVEGRFRSVRGDTWLRFNEYNTWLPEGNSITLWREKNQPRFLCFRTSQQNGGKVEIRRSVAGGVIRIRVPRAASGCVEQMAGADKTKITNEVTSNKQEKIEVATEFGSNATAVIGPGAYAIIDNRTGGIEVTDDTFDSNIGEEIPDFDPVDDASDASVSTRTVR